ncbi:rRNA maturation protein [Geoglobus acetivorans]|uniref:Probable Brix domain-containing ribosomal biogenesis protein n=1 Tax=Geoglobus acetivorans TaxID=565033 RepID=A0A0A7GE03_GEOAI|nr:ribosomal biogenesis protein [Geoglobus acetivorans]
MITLTTSRDPSQRTRSFAKVISRYMNWYYLQRGKLSMEDLFEKSDRIVLIREIKGNPAFLDLYTGNKKSMTMRINVGTIKKEKMDDSPVYFAGRLPFDPVILGAMPKIDAGEKLARKLNLKKIVYARKDGKLIFTFDGREVLTVKLLGVYEG